MLLLKETLFDDAFSLLSKGDLDPRVVIHLFANLSQPKCLRDEPRILLFEGVRDIYESIGHIEDLGNDDEHFFFFAALCRLILMKYNLQ